MGVSQSQIKSAEEQKSRSPVPLSAASGAALIVLGHPFIAIAEQGSEPTAGTQRARWLVEFFQLGCGERFLNLDRTRPVRNVEHSLVFSYFVRLCEVAECGQFGEKRSLVDRALWGDEWAGRRAV